MTWKALKSLVLAVSLTTAARAGMAEVSGAAASPANILSIPAPAFQPTSPSVVWAYDDLGYLYATGGGTQASLFVAPVNLPDGAAVDSIGLYYCMDDPTAFILAAFRTLPGGGSDDAPPVIADLGFALTPLAATGCSYISSPLGAATINNNADNGGGKLYIIDIQINNPTAEARFRGVDVRWHRQVSPAPASATFNDVPTSDPAFQFVEAFYAAGITAGCSAAPPLYCPDSSVTRRQMAVFFARALGLQWPQ